MSLGPHAFYIVAAYIVTAVVVVTMVIHAALSHRAQLRALAELEGRGLRRRSSVPASSVAEESLRRIGRTEAPGRG